MRPPTRIGSGALTRWADVAGAALPSRFDGLPPRRQVGAVQVQNAATVGGNLSTHRRPLTDPAALTLDASVE